MPERVSRSQRSQTSFVGCLRRNGRRRGQCLFQHSSQIGTVLNILSLLGESLSLLGESIHAFAVASVLLLASRRAHHGVALLHPGACSVIHHWPRWQCDPLAELIERLVAILPRR